MTTYKTQPVRNMNTQSNLRSIAVLGAVCLAGSALVLSGCSKSKSGNSSASSSNGGPASGSGVTALKIKWPAGKQFDMQMNLNQASDIDVPNQPIHQVLKLTQGLQYSPLKELDNGGHEVKLQFESQNMNFSQNGQELVNYDSSDKATDETNRATKAVAAVVSAMLDTPLVYTIAADGTVEKIDGTDALMKRITTAMPDQRQRSQLQQMFDEDTLKRYGELAKGLPDHPVSPGDTWTLSQDINNQTGVMTVDTTYTFKGMEQHNGHNCAHLVVTGDIKTKSASAAATGMMVTVKKGTVSGDTWFDPDLGMFVDINSDQDLTMNIKTQTMTLTDRLKQNVALSLVDDSK
jgi:hypothetical protein